MGVVFRSDAEVVNGTAGTSVTVTKPAGTANGDFLLAFVAEVGVGSITAPAGWTLIGSVASGSSVTEAAYYKVAASEGASWTWTLGASVRNWGWVGSYTGVNTGDPFLFSSSANTFFSATNLFPTLSRFSALPGWYGVFGSASVRTASGSATTWVPNSLLTERFDGSTNGGSGTDITGSVADVEFATEYVKLLAGIGTASQAQTACATWSFLLRPQITEFDGGLLEPIAEVEINGVWVDVSDRVRENTKATITVGRSNAASVVPPTRITLTLDNDDSRFTDDDPTGIYYPHFRTGIRLRVSVPYGYNPPTELATAFIDSIEPDWDLSTRDAIVNITASGRLRRLQRGEVPLVPPLQRTIGASGVLGVPPVAYWTFQDGSDATQAASEVGGLPCAVGGVTFAADSTLAGSGPLARVSTGATISGSIASHDNPGHWIVGVFLKVPSSPAADSMLFQVTTTGTAAIWQVRLIAGSPDSLQATAFDSAGTTIGTTSTGIDEAEIYGQWILFILAAVTDGSDVDYEVAYFDGEDGSGASNTLTSRTHGIVSNWSVTAPVGLDQSGIGHAFVIANPDFDPTFGYLAFGPAFDGFDGDTPLARTTRLASEVGEPLISIQVIGETSITMGPQPASTFVSATREAEEVGHALLHDGGPGGDLVWLMRSTRYNADTRMTLDMSQGQLAPPFRPVRDDQLIRNDWVISRQGGSSARATQETGPMSVNPAPDGVGRYRDSRTLNLHDDTYLSQLAAWRVNEGTATDKRYPVIAGDLRGSPELVEDWLNCRIGARIKATNLMSQHPSVIDADVFIEGWTQVISTDTWKFGLNTSPASPYTVAVLDDDVLGKLDSGSSTLISGIDDDDTSLTIATSLAADKWTTDSGEMPIPIVVGGEDMTVTGIADVSPAFVAAGTAVHGNNTSLAPGLPAGLAAGDLLLLRAVIRNSGTGVPDSPGDDWDLLLDMSNARLYGKYAVSGEPTPAVTFTGGVANATTSAQTAAFRGVSITVHNSATQLNSSAQNIAYPALTITRNNCVVLTCGWKADDWTTTSPPGTKIADPSSQTGDDQGLTWSYSIQTTATSQASGSITVTDGGGAISRGGVLALATDVQTMTVTRSVNGVVKAHTAGAGAVSEVHVKDPIRLAL